MGIAELRKSLCQSCCRTGKSNPNYGKISVLRGKKIEDFRSKESVKLTKQRLSKGLFRNHKHSEKSKKQIGLSVLGEKNGFYGRKHTKKTKEIIRQKTIQQHIDGRIKTTKTSIELMCEKLLKELNLKYIFQYPYGYWVYDFYIPKYKLFIECDGDYWHANPKFYKKKNLDKIQLKNIANDKRKNNFVLKQGQSIIRFWGTTIKNNPTIIKSKIIEKCSN